MAVIITECGLGLGPKVLRMCYTSNSNFFFIKIAASLPLTSCPARRTQYTPSLALRQTPHPALSTIDLLPEMYCTIPLSHPLFHHLQSFTTPSILLFTPSLNTYPCATGLIHTPPPAFTPLGALFNLSVKNTGCLLEASNTAISCASAGVGRTDRGVASGGMASI